MTNKTTKFLFTVMALILMSNGLIFSAEAQQPAADYRKLRDLPVLVEDRHGQWVGAGNGLAINYEIICNNPYLPIDGDNNGLPAYHILVTGQSEGGWWNALFAGVDWESYSVAPYYPSGALSFDIKGAFGGEDFQIGVQDVDYEREEQHIQSDKVLLSDYISVTTNWQSVNIPILDLVPGTGEFNLNQMHGIILASSSTSPNELWISNLRWTSNAQEAGFPSVKVNQLGYIEDGAKYAYVTGFEEELTARAGTPFEVREVGNNQVAYSGELELVSEFDAGASGERVLRADFSPLTTPGDYYMAVSAYRVDDSPPFAIGNGVYSELLVDAARYYYLQRQGIALDASHAGIFARDIGHLQDSTALFRSGGDEVVDVSQGWYDAGDYGKYVNAGAIALSDLFWAYELFPDQFVDNQFNIPEGGNGIPDLLDEARWELDFILKMQDPTSGGFYHMVQPTEYVPPQDATEARYIEDVRLVSTVTEDEDPIGSIVGCGETVVDGTKVQPTSTSGYAVAALAHAALVFADIDPAYSEQLLNSAEFGWQYLTQNADGVAPVDGPYRDDDDIDDRFWAASVLLRATDKQEYHDVVLQNYRTVRTDFLSQDENAYGIEKTGQIGVWHYFHYDSPDETALGYLANEFGIWRDHMIQRQNTSVWQTTLLDEDYYWGSNYVALATPLSLAIAARGLADYDETITNMTKSALNYLLGVNPLRLSYVSGVGEDSVENLFSAIWSYDGQPGVPPGILVGGPNAYSDPLIYSNFPAKRYIDNKSAWTVNEHTIYWNSALVFATALVADSATQPPAQEPTPVPTAVPIARAAEPTETPAPAAPEPTRFPVEAPAPEPGGGMASRIVTILAIVFVSTAVVLGATWAFYLRK